MGGILNQEPLAPPDLSTPIALGIILYQKLLKSLDNKSWDEELNEEIEKIEKKKT